MVQRRRSPKVGAALLVLTALAFTLTASAYTVLAFQKLGAAAGVLQADSGLLAFLDRHGAGLLGAELVALALAAGAAIALDRRPTGRPGSATNPPARQDPESHQSGVP